MRVAMDAACKEAERLAQILASEFGVERVYLFGSFVWGPEIRPDSDIDLAVEGLPSGKLISADVSLSRASSFSVDLFPLEDLYPRLHNRILESGLLIYESRPKNPPR